MGFSKLHLSPPLTRVLERQGYTVPTPIQEKAIPVILAGKDIMGLAQTGTGKTAAFALPILEKLMKSLPDKTQRGHRHSRVLVLAPTRELATQIGESFATYGVETGLSHTTIFGGVSQFHQVRAIQHGVDIIIATPGRLIDLMEQRLVTLQHIEFFILDEADRMLDMGFIAPIRRIASALPAKRQTLMFSATMDKEVNKLAQTLLREPTLVEVPRQGVASEQVEQLLYFVQHHEKQALLTHLLKLPEFTRVVVFTKTKHGAERVGKRLTRSGINAETIHGNKAQNARTRALDRFRSGYSPVLVATDVAARGLDVDDISHVINMDLPMEPDAYVHRIGRTGRAGATGKSISFCDQSERGLLRDVERLLKKNIPTAPLPEFSRIIEEVVPSYEQRGEQRSEGRGEGRGDRRGSRRSDESRESREPKGPPRDKPAARGSTGLRKPEGAPERAPRETREEMAPVRSVFNASRTEADNFQPSNVEAQRGQERANDGERSSTGRSGPSKANPGKSTRAATPRFGPRSADRNDRPRSGRFNQDGPREPRPYQPQPAPRPPHPDEGGRAPRPLIWEQPGHQSRAIQRPPRAGAPKDGAGNDGASRADQSDARDGQRGNIAFSGGASRDPRDRRSGSRSGPAPRFDDRGAPPRQGGGVKKLSGADGAPGAKREGGKSFGAGKPNGGRSGGGKSFGSKPFGSKPGGRKSGPSR